MPPDRRSTDIGRGLSRYPPMADAPDREAARACLPEALFLGPKGENAEDLEQLIVEAVRDHVFWRRNYHPGDPTAIDEEMKRSPEYLQTLGSTRENYRSLLAFLKKSVPFFSARYQGHMNSDLLIPGILGYFAAMLYNANNVAFEGSTATTLLEMSVGDDLCRMLGYAIPDAGAIRAAAVRPWGHLTSGGSVANVEAIWSARNLKFLPLSLQAALRHEPSLNPARDMTVPLPTGEVLPLVEADAWSLLNMKGDEILALPARLTGGYGIPLETITAAVSDNLVQTLGMHEFSRRYLGSLEWQPVIVVPGTKHYSFPKAAAMLGIGTANLVDVAVDRDGRLSMEKLREVLERCLAERRPVYTVVGVIGSTEESAVDPLADILTLRDELRAAGLEFTVHADAAWGGYHASLIRDEPATVGSAAPGVRPLSRYVARQLEALGQADSITVDPHKGGYVPYPAGALCYRNSAMRDLVTFKAPVLWHGEEEPNMGLFGVEGSRPGASAAAVYLSHRVVPPSKGGYGTIVGRATLNCKLFYARLLCMARPEDPFVVIPLPRLPAEAAGGDAEREIEFIRASIDRRPIDELVADDEAMRLLAELGPDLNILAYAFNFKKFSGAINADLALANRLNKAIYEKLSIRFGDDIYGYDLLVSTSELAVDQYGDDFIEDYKRRLGVAGSPGGRVTVLRSVAMDPWPLSTSRGSFLDVIEAELRSALTDWIKDRNTYILERG